MQNKYFGDIGDFGKFGLLRHLVQEQPIRLGVIWYLVPDSVGDNNGQFVDYLQASRSALRPCDTYLFDMLAVSVQRGLRNVGEVQRHALFAAETAYFAEPHSYPPGATQPERQRLRGQWLSDALDKTVECDLVFLDPDNGLESPSISRTSRDGPKYVYYDDLEPMVQRGQSIVLYHHVDRSASAEVQARRRAKELQERLGIDQPHVLMFRRRSARFYFIIPGQSLREHLANRVQSFASGPWRAHFDVVL